MWLDKDRTVHTVSLPDPAGVIAPAVRQAIQATSHDRLLTLSSALTKLEEGFYDRVESGRIRAGQDENAFVGKPLSEQIGTAGTTSLRALLQWLDALDARWQLDALMVVQEFVDEMLDEI